MAVSGLIQDKPVKKHKLSSTFCSFTPCSPLLSFVLSNEATVDQRLSFLERHHRRFGVILIALLTLVYCARTHGFETALVTLMSAHQRDDSSIALQPVSSPCSQYRRHLAVSPLALLPAVSQPCSRSRRLTVSIVTLLSASSPCCWSP